MKKVLIFISFLCAIIPVSFRNVQAQGNSKQEVIIANEMLSPIPALSSSETMMVSLGIYHSSVLSSTGRVFTWGLGGYGQLGNSTTTYSHVPTDITTRFGLLGDDKIIQLSLGNFHSSALSSTGRVYTWGFNFYGQLGNNTGVDSSVPYEITDQFGLSGEDKIIQLSMGVFHSSALSSTGRVFSWGYNFYGQLGNNTYVNTGVPVEITPLFDLSGDDKIIQLSMGGEHSSALSSAGRVFTWGSNGNGQLGNNTTTTSYVPIEITNQFVLSGDDKIIQISMGVNHSSALSSAGRVFTWGYNIYGQLGNETISTSLVPIEITNRFGLSDDDQIIQLSMGAYHSSALSSIGKVFTWGRNNYGQLGNDTISTSPVPIEITNRFGLSDDNKIIQLSMGVEHSAALSSAGKVFTWGRNNTGQLGNGTTTDSLVPFAIVIQSKITFESNGGSSIATIEQDPGTDVVSPTAPTKNGYAFGGWYSDSDLTQSYSFEKMPATDITLYAKWNTVSYDIAYTLNGGTNHGSNPATYHIETATITLGSPTKAGHTFSGWFDNADFTGNAITEIPLGSYGNKTFYAKWTINQYTITFNSNGGSAINAITQNYDTSITAPSNPTKEGYSFNGWSSVIPTKMPAENIVIEAYWLLLATQADEKVNVEVQGLLDGIPTSLIQNKEVEIIFNLELKDAIEIPVSDAQLVNEITKRNEATRFIDISLILRVQGESDVFLSELEQPIRITISIPEADRGYQNYRVIRIHNGVLDVLETEYDKAEATLTFETDRFSTYSILYNTSSGAWAWWLLLLLLIPLGYLGYRYHPVLLGYLKKTRKEEKKEETKEKEIQA